MTMSSDPARFLLQNGALVLGAGVLCGVPFFLAIVLGWGPERTRAWRVAHATLLADGLLLLVAGILLSTLPVATGLREALSWSLVLSAWAFVFALGGGAAAGRRGLVPWPPGWNTVFFLGHAVGAAGSAIGVALLAVALLL
jgi:hypothetical protein